jgi:hypothetical protein
MAAAAAMTTTDKTVPPPHYRRGPAGAWRRQRPTRQLPAHYRIGEDRQEQEGSCICYDSDRQDSPLCTFGGDQQEYDGSSSCYDSDRRDSPPRTDDADVTRAVLAATTFNPNFSRRTNYPSDNGTNRGGDGRNRHSRYEAICAAVFLTKGAEDLICKLFRFVFSFMYILYCACGKNC